MTPEQFRDGRRNLGLSTKNLAELFGVSSGRTVRRWEAGERDIPGPAIRLMTWLTTGEKPTL